MKDPGRDQAVTRAARGCFGCEIHAW
jgi:hypothetical protein